MKRIFFVLMIFFFVHVGTHAQNYFSVTVFSGLSNYEGDLQQKQYTFQETHFAYGAGILYDITSKLIARANFNFGVISGNDKKSKDSEYIKRNLNFTSNLVTFQLGLEYDFINTENYLASPYIFCGAEFFHFNPYTYDTLGVKTYLQPLGTEGQGFYDGRKKYNLNQISIPFGAGLKFAVTDNLKIGLEVGMRKTFTDYLDDVSTTYADPNLLLKYSGKEAVELASRGNELHTGLTYPPAGSVRGNSKNKDWYYFSGITFTYRLNFESEKDYYYYRGKRR